MIKNLTVVVIAFGFYIYEIYSFIMRASLETVSANNAVIMCLQAMILFFAIPAIFLGQLISRIFNLEWGINFVQLKMFYFFLYFLLVAFFIMDLLDKIF